MYNLFKKFIIKVENSFNKKEKLAVIFTLIIVLSLVFIPYALFNGMTLPFNGDYSLQQVYFYFEGYDAFWDFFRTGEFKMWSYSSYLGVNYFAANTFYYITSPFLIPLLFFPRFLLIQGIFITYLLKLLLGGFFMYILLRKYFRLSINISLLSGIIYMLNGWGMFYMWFNHFADVMAVLPLLFIATEHFLQNKKGSLISISIFLLGITNYYFLFSFIILMPFYSLFRFLSLYNLKKDYILLIKGMSFYAIGLALTSFVLIPSFLMVIDIPRLAESSLLSELLSPKSISDLVNYLFVFKDRLLGNNITSTQNFMYPIVSLLFPVVSNWDSIIFENVGYDNAQSSMYMTTIFTLFLLPAIYQQFKNKNFKNVFLIITIIFLTFIPITYYVLNAFSQIYGRWHLFLVILIIIFVSNYLEKISENTALNNKIIITSSATLIFLMIIVFNYSRYIFNIGYKNNYNIYFVFLFALYLLATLFILIFKNSKKLRIYIMIFASVEIVATGHIAINGVGYNDYNDLYLNSESTKIYKSLVSELNNNDESFYRTFIDYDYGLFNIPMYLKSKGLSGYHSVFSFSLADFNNNSRVGMAKDSWLLMINDKRIFLESFLNVKYRIMPNSNINVPFGFKLVKDTGLYSLFENENHIELGFAYDNLFDNSNYEYSDYYFQNDVDYLKMARLNNDDLSELSSQYDFNIINSTQLNFKEFDAKKERRVCSLATVENPCHLIVKMEFGSYVKATFYNNERIIADDITILNPYNSDFKNSRGYYLYEPADAIDFRTDNNQPIKFTNSDKIEYYYIYYNDFMEIIKPLKDNRFENINHSNNKISFSTNYETEKFIVLSVPFDRGWNLRVNGVKQKIYNANNGFIGFIAPQGEATYRIDYFTPGLLFGLIITFLGLILLFFAYLKFDRKVTSIKLLFKNLFFRKNPKHNNNVNVVEKLDGVVLNSDN